MNLNLLYVYSFSDIYWLFIILFIRPFIFIIFIIFVKSSFSLFIISVYSFTHTFYFLIDLTTNSISISSLSFWADNCLNNSDTPIFKLFYSPILWSFPSPLSRPGNPTIFTCHTSGPYQNPPTTIFLHILLIILQAPPTRN